MAYIHFEKRIPYANLVLAILENYEPDDICKDIMLRLTKIESEIEIVETLVDKVNQKICPNWDT